MERIAELERRTTETQIAAQVKLDGAGSHDISTGIAFFDHMLTLFSVHGFFDLQVKAVGDIEVDYHHTVEDVGLVIGSILADAVGDKKGIVRYGHAVTPMDDALSEVSLDFCGRPYLVYDLPDTIEAAGGFNIHLAREFFRALANTAGLNLHIHVRYGANDHHVTESVFKSFGRALDQATAFDRRITEVHSSKGKL